MRKNQWPDNLYSTLETKKIIAVLVIDNVDDAVPTARALFNGGVDILELTFRTPAAFDSLCVIKKELPQMLVGAGTVLTKDQCMQAKEAKADFAVAPGFNPRVLQSAIDLGLPFGPGIATPSEIEQAFELGCHIQKLYPAQRLGGVNYLRDINAPYAHLNIRYVPLGGINTENLSQWLLCSQVIAVGGSWIAPRRLISQHEWGEIERNASEARTIADSVG